MKVDIKGLDAFCAVVEYKSFEKAAKSLFITQSAVSQRIKLLESSLGQAVLVRTPKISATKAGFSLLKYAKNLEQLNSALKFDLDPTMHHDWRKISIASNADTLSTWLLKALAPWCQQHKILLDIKIDDQDDTHKLLHTGEVLGCISSIQERSPHFSCRELGKIDYFAIASPQLMDSHFCNGVNSVSLANSSFVRFNEKDQLQHQFLKQYYNIDGQTLKQHCIPSPDGYLEWIKKGMGFGMAPLEQIQPYLTSNELILLAPDKTISIPLYWLQWGIKTDLGESLAKCLLSFTQEM